MAKKVLVLTPCPPLKKCPVCIARMNHAMKFYGVEAVVPEQLVVMEDVKLPKQEVTN